MASSTSRKWNQGRSQIFGRGGQRGGNRKYFLNFKKNLQNKLKKFSINSQ